MSKEAKNIKAPNGVIIGPKGVLYIDPVKVFPHMLPRYAQLSVAAVLKAHQKGMVLVK